MKSAVAWNVKGVGTDARETAREAARRAGLSVGEWLNSVIAEAADDAAHGSLHNGQRSEAAGFSAIHEHLDQLAVRLGNTRPAGRASAREQRRNNIAEDLHGLEAWLASLSKELARCSQETPQRIADAINRLNERIDHLIVNGRTAASEFQRRVAAVDDALEELGGAAQHAAFPQRASEDPLREIRARQRALDEPSSARERHAFDAGVGMSPNRWGGRTSELDRQLQDLTRKLETMRRPCAFEESVAALRDDLGRIGDALAQAMPRCALDALETQVQSLANRVDRGRQRGGDAVALSAVEQRLRKLNDQLADLTPAENIGELEAAVDALSGKIDVLAANGPDLASLEHLETAVVELRRITERVASGEALATLAQEVRMLAERMDRFVGSERHDGLSSLEQRVEELSRSINARAAEAHGASSARLEALIGELTGQLRRLDLGDRDRAALDHIEGQIAMLAEKINASDMRLGTIEAIERGIADLVLQIEEARAHFVEASTFKRDLADLRLTQTEADRRTQEMLGAVHDTIDRLADRLTLIESEKRAVARSTPAPGTPAQAFVPATSPVPADADAAPGPLPAQSAGRLAPPSATPPRPAIDPTLPADHPLEPGSAGPRGRAATPAERIAASEAVLAPLKSNGAAETSDKANFIAAARRAAQAAAAEAAQSGGRRAADAAAAAGLDETGETAGTFKRPLFMSIAAAILVVGATHVTLTMLGSSGSGPAEAPRQVAATARGPDTAKIEATPATSAAPLIEDVSAKPVSPIGTQALSSGSLANSGIIGAPIVSPAAPPPRQDGKPGASTADVAASSSRASDVTGSLPKPADGAALGIPATAPTASPAAPAADGLPAAIGSPGLRSAAAAGQPAAQYEIAIRYAEGRGIPQNFGEAARWLERAAAQGLAPAQYRLGSFYEKGHGVKKDLEAARRLYTAAADKGNARAMHNLAVLYAEGIDGKPEYKIAFQWFRKAAAHGVADSQYNLGILYARGIGVEQNLAESYKWFALAAQQGDQDAGRKRDDVAARLDPQSLVAAKLAAQTFTVESQPEDATTVKAPAGGWDRPATAAETAPVKRKPAPHRI